MRSTLILLRIIGMIGLLCPTEGWCEEEAVQGDIVFTPTELFQGDTARIAPHLNLAGWGCVKVEYPGQKAVALFKEVWRKGKSKTENYGGGDPRSPGEISFSLRKPKEDMGNYPLTIYYSGTTSRGHLKIPTPKPGHEISFVNLKDPIRASNDEAVAIWCILVGKGMDRTKDKPMEELAKEAEWATIFKMKLSKSRIAD